MFQFIDLCKNKCHYCSIYVRVVRFTFLILYTISKVGLRASSVFRNVQRGKKQFPKLSSKFLIAREAVYACAKNIYSTCMYVHDPMHHIQNYVQSHDKHTVLLDVMRCAGQMGLEQESQNERVLRLQEHLPLVGRERITGPGSAGTW